LYQAQQAEKRRESGERNAVESGFGVGKHHYSMGLVEHLKETSEVSNHICVPTVNLWMEIPEAVSSFFFFG
jgi:hypothetical protein